MQNASFHSLRPTRIDFGPTRVTVNASENLSLSDERSIASGGIGGVTSPPFHLYSPRETARDFAHQLNKHLKAGLSVRKNDASPIIVDCLDDESNSEADISFET